MAARRVLQHAERVWYEMHAKATPLDQLAGKDRYLRGMVPVGTMGVFVGSMMEVCRQQGWSSTGKYDQIKRALVAMGTIAMLRRGAAHRESAWALLQRPTEALFAERAGPGPHGRRPRVPAVTGEVIEPDGLAAFLAKTPAGRVEALKDMTSAASFLAVKALVEVLETSDNSQAKTAAARALLALGRDVGGLQDDPLGHFAQEWGSELEQVHATPAPA